MTIYPFIIHVGPLEITGYGLMLMVAFLMGGWLIARQLRENKLKEDYAADIVAPQSSAASSEPSSGTWP